LEDLPRLGQARDEAGNMNLVSHLMAMRLGARVRAPHPIVYMDTGYEVAEGTLGTVRLVTCAGGVVGIEWEGDEPGLLRRTAFNSVEVVS
jgi:hypothetical protein